MRKFQRAALAALCALLLFTAIPAFAEESAAVSVSFSMPKGATGKEELLTDGRADTYVTLSESTKLTVSVENAASLVLRWHDLPEGVKIACRADGKLLSEEAANETMLNVVLSLPEGTTDVVISTSKNDSAKLSDVQAYAAGDLPETIQQWNAPTQADVLLIVPFGGDEYRYFGGLIPTLQKQDVSFNVCFMGDYSRRRVEESLSALWTLGVRTYPLFVSCDEKPTLDYKTLTDFWDTKAANKSLASVFSAVQPQVVITCAASERGEAAARLTNELVVKAAKKADSLQKLYAHAETEAGTVIEYAEGAAAIAQSALDSFASLRVYHAAVSESRAFELLFSRVGEDETCDSLFEHLTVAAEPLVTPSPVPTETPAPTASSTATPAPTQTASPSPTEAPTAEPSATPKRGLFSCAAKPVSSATQVPTVQPTVTPTIEPTAEPSATPTATPEPTVEPAPEPTATPDPWAQYFRLADEPAEVVSVDEENGLWSYRSDELSIQIERRETTGERGPLTYYVAHIRMRTDQYRSAFGNETRTGRTSAQPTLIARRYRAVLLITGDNMLNQDAKDKAVLIRDGRVYQKRTEATTLMWDVENLTYEMFGADKTTYKKLLERGAWDVFSFGPILIENSVINPRLSRETLFQLNPRTGIGAVEPGHLVAIVTDGRIEGRTPGFELDDFAQLFADEGCVSAYNLDGGQSAIMVFMGEALNRHDNQIGKNAGRQRPVPDGLTWGYSELVPSEKDPVYNTGAVK